MRLSAIILSSLFSAVPSYPLFNFGKSLPELHKWIVKDGSQVDPHSHLNLKDRLMAAGDTGDTGDRPPVSPGNDFITDWDPIIWAAQPTI